MECVYVQVIISQIRSYLPNDDSRMTYKRMTILESAGRYWWKGDQLSKSRYSPETNCIIRSKVKPLEVEKSEIAWTYFRENQKCKIHERQNYFKNQIWKKRIEFIYQNSSIEYR